MSGIHYFFYSYVCEGLHILSIFTKCTIMWKFSAYPLYYSAMKQNCTSLCHRYFLRGSLHESESDPFRSCCDHRGLKYICSLHESGLSYGSSFMFTNTLR